MAYYKLVSRGRSDSQVDEVIFEGEDGARRSVRADVSSELSDQDVQAVEGLGYEVEEVEAPDRASQPVGSDVAGMSPVIGQASTGEPAVSQSGMRDIQNQTRESDVDQSTEGQSPREI